MGKYVIDETTLTGIGDAIREKEGSTEGIDPNDMKTRIQAIDTQEDLDEEMATQDELIEQVNEALIGKTGGGSKPEPVIEELLITENGTYEADDGVDGYSPVVVRVDASSGVAEIDMCKLQVICETDASACNGFYCTRVWEGRLQSNKINSFYGTGASETVENVACGSLIMMYITGNKPFNIMSHIFKSIQICKWP